MLMDFLKQDPKFKLQWQSSNTGDMDIRFSGTLFILIGSQPYQCHQGKDLNASKKIYYNEVKKKKLLFEHSLIRSRKLPQPTKKMECPVTFETKKIISFPELSVKKIPNGIGLNLQDS